MPSYEVFVRNMGLYPRYQKFSLSRDPFPAIPIFAPSCNSPNPVYSCGAIFKKEFETVVEILSRARSYRKTLILFVEGFQGVGKSHFLGEVAANCRDPTIFPIFCQIYTGGGFSDITDRTLQWLGLGGYMQLILSFLNRVGMSESDIFTKSPYTIFHDLVPTFQEVFGIENRRILERILKAFLNLDVGYSELFQTSHKYKNLILVTLVYLVRKAVDKKTVLIIDNLENRWPYFTSLNKEHFYNNMEHFIRLTEGDVILMFSDNGYIRKELFQALREMKIEFSMRRIQLPKLTLSKFINLVSGYLGTSRLKESKVHDLHPFNKKTVKYIHGMSHQNTRVFLELCHDILEESLEYDCSKITPSDIKKMLSQ
jgi:hypothetical protein